MPIHMFPTMQPTHAARRIEVGSTMYLLQHDAGVYAPRLIISAHGGLDRNTLPTFTVPVGVTLYFYSNHGAPAGASSLSAATLNGLHTGPTSVGGTLCYNYSLSKFQGYHGSAAGVVRETYAAIQQYQDNQDALNAMAMGAPAGLVLPPGYAGGLQHFDVLTIRNRFFSGNVTLQAAINAVRNQHPYAHIHCAFCRSLT